MAGVDDVEIFVSPGEEPTKGKFDSSKTTSLEI
jgi:hypothetical protein